MNEVKYKSCLLPIGIVFSVIGLLVLALSTVELVAYPEVLGGDGDFLSLLLGKTEPSVYDNMMYLYDEFLTPEYSLYLAIGACVIFSLSICFFVLTIVLSSPKLQKIFVSFSFVFGILAIVPNLLVYESIVSIYLTSAIPFLGDGIVAAMFGYGLTGFVTSIFAILGNIFLVIYVVKRDKFIIKNSSVKAIEKADVEKIKSEALKATQTEVVEAPVQEVVVPQPVVEQVPVQAEPTPQPVVTTINVSLPEYQQPAEEQPVQEEAPVEQPVEAQPVEEPVVQSVPAPVKKKKAPAKKKKAVAKKKPAAKKKKPVVAEPAPVQNEIPVQKVSVKTDGVTPNQPILINLHADGTATVGTPEEINAYQQAYPQAVVGGQVLNQFPNQQVPGQVTPVFVTMPAMPQPAPAPAPAAVVETPAVKKAPAKKKKAATKKKVVAKKKPATTNETVKITVSTPVNQGPKKPVVISLDGEEINLDEELNKGK
ncbi:MAG: hypothetical protein LBC44_01375 [Mycoplasmataceae bacterium]|nr:hypothetical protein [Mycoplasmataceae bacterium]